ncbi:filamentous haemagglutinin family protein, partial [Burkholderia pseudomultivorans]|uniref:filamentous haemagglutinin family protein n=1 Tax=Burkholderia pseudomultivorans TaxID=1207504 RepID=UPI000B2D6B80
FDVTQYAPAGAISLTADKGTVDVQSGSTLDFSGATGGGAAGSLTLSAPQQVVNLNGTLKGGAANGYAGGSLILDTAGTVDLDGLAKTLASSGVNSAITVHTKTGNLTLSAGNTLTAHAVSLTADGGAGRASDTANGNVNILGMIDASGNAGGEIDLYGKSGVDIEGTLLARGSDPAQRGGKVNIGTSATFDPAIVDANGHSIANNATYGYENIDPAHSGRIVLGANALIDVSGGTAGGLSGGTVNFRAPLLMDGTVDVTLNAPSDPGKYGIKGARATTLEAYAVWSTTDATTGAQHFDGIVDPAGWYDSNGHLLAGTFTAQGTSSTPTTFSFTPDGSGGGTVKNNATGTTSTVTQAQLQRGDTEIGFGGLQSMFFAPLSDGANADHQTFYGYQGGDATKAVSGTLMGFVQHGLDAMQNPFTGTGIANARIVPSIELDNPSQAINGGNIEVLTNWNLGAGTSQTDPAFRFHGQAPIVTLRAENNVDVKASLTDGFFEIVNPTGTGIMINVPAPLTYSQLMGLIDDPKNYYYFGYYLNHGMKAPFDLPAKLTSGDPAEIGQYYGLYSAYLNYLDSPVDAVLQHVGYWGGIASLLMPYATVPGGWSSQPVAAGQPTLTVPYPTGAAQSDAAAYLRYLASYNSYLDSEIQFFKSTGVKPYVDVLKPPPAVLGPVLSVSSIVISPPVTDNSPAPVAVPGNALPLLSASLAAGSSASYRVVAGADLSSTNPLALKPVSAFSSSAQSTVANGGNVILDGHFEYDNSTNPNLGNPNSLAVVAPTMIRTGSGSIDVAAANSVSLFDPKTLQDPTATVIPGVIYTAGVPSTNAPPAPAGATVVQSSQTPWPNILVGSVVNPEAAGDISIHAQGNIAGIENVIDTNGAISGLAGASIGQFWWQWMQVRDQPTAKYNGTTYAFSPINRTSIDFGAFDQGILSVGGNVSIDAGGNITDLAVSLPTTWYKDSNGVPVIVGGGNLTVRAGGDILSGDYFVAKGAGTITAGGRIGSDVIVPPWLLSQQPITVATLLATQDGVIDVSARQGADIGGVFDPSYVLSSVLLNNYQQYADGQGYSSKSAVKVSTTTGDVIFGSLNPKLVIGGGAFGSMGSNDWSFILPASANVTAFTGGIRVESSGALYPSAYGNLSLIADQSVNIAIGADGFAANAKRGSRPIFGMLDMDPSLMPSAANPNADVGLPDETTLGAHTAALHADDTTPVRIYSLNGDIVDSVLVTSGGAASYSSPATLSFDKPALIEAGRDIVNLAFQGQNLRKSDVTRIVAGRDIYDAPYDAAQSYVVPALTLGGPGTFDIEAGRNIGPLTNQQVVKDSRKLTGIDAIGNAINPYLPHESANVNVLFGVGPGIDTTAFISTYVDPAASVAGVPSATPALISFVQQYEAGLSVDTGLVNDQPPLKPLNADEAWSKFKALPQYVQRLFAEQVLFSVLTQVGEDYNNPASAYYQKYARGYEALNTMFPASLGYTANNLGGGSNGANKPVDTGDLDMRSTTIQTQQGGSISILGPGGQLLVGSTSAPPQIVDSGKVVAGPGTMGILTLEKGDVNIFTDQSVLLAQSRIFTEQGGDMTIWSSNGDINAGKGSKSSADTPAPQYVCDANHYCTVDARGEVTGAGIATLQSLPGVPAGTVNLIAPRGTVDAGDAGIRAGNLNVAALRVANADNIQVTGKATGIPMVQAVNTGALTAASSAASAASQMAQDIAKNNASGGSQRRWTISVQVEGFGDPAAADQKKRRGAETVGYRPNASVAVLGLGEPGDTQRRFLTREEQNRLSGS